MEDRLQHQTALTVQVPKVHWCGNYIFQKGHEFEGQVIPDGFDCCWWHWTGLPRRWGQRHPAYSWQETTFREYFNEHIRLFYTRKPPKVGGTRTWLGLALHESCVNNDWADGQVAIVVGTRGKEAEKMIERCKEIISLKDENGVPLREVDGTIRTKIAIDQDYNNRQEFSLNSVEFRAHPANNIDSIRSQPNMRMILVDEIAFFQMVEQQRIRDAFEHYIGGADVIISLLTTTGDIPEGVAYDIEREEPSMYRKHIYDYNIGLVVHPQSMTSLYRKDDIDKLRGSPSFNRNFLGIWGHGTGDIFNIDALNACSRETYDLYPQSDWPILGIDPGYGSSKFGIVGGEMRDGIAHILHAEQYERGSQSNMIAIVNSLIKTYGYRQLGVDSNNPGFIAEFNNAKPKSFRERGQLMTDGAASAVQQKKVKIHPQFEELLQQLRAVQKNEKGLPDKKKMTYDLGDAFHILIDDLIGQPFYGTKLKDY